MEFRKALGGRHHRQVAACVTPGNTFQLNHELLPFLYEVCCLESLLASTAP
jgi:hypothetical protein